MVTVPDIIDSLGGAKAIADAIQVPMTTVHSWKRAGYVPTWRISGLLDLASEKGMTLSADDFPTAKPAKMARAA